jgi:hypothetical protein
MAQQQRASNPRMRMTVFLAGFDAPRAEQVGRLLEDCSALAADWRATQDPAADLWIVDGAKARSRGRGLLEIVGPAPLRVRPAEMPHPVAFTEPLHDSVSTAHRFDPQSLQSLNVLLAQLARWLGPRLTQQALVGQLLESGASFTRSNVIEVRTRGRVLAVMDFEGDTAVAPDALPADIKRADWRLQARGGALLPPGFRIASTQLVLWQFAQRSERTDLLPPRYMRLPIHLRDMPRLAPREVPDPALAVLRELAYGARGFGELAQRTGLDEPLLRRQLGALYLVGAITCDPGRSRAAREHRRGESLRPEDLSFIGRPPLNTADLTAPGLSPY